MHPIADLQIVLPICIARLGTPRRKSVLRDAGWIHECERCRDFGNAPRTSPSQSKREREREREKENRVMVVPLALLRISAGCLVHFVAIVSWSAGVSVLGMVGGEWQNGRRAFLNNKKPQRGLHSLTPSYLRKHFTTSTHRRHSCLATRSQQSSSTTEGTKHWHKAYPQKQTYDPRE